MIKKVLGLLFIIIILSGAVILGMANMTTPTPTDQATPTPTPAPQPTTNIITTQYGETLFMQGITLETDTSTVDMNSQEVRDEFNRIHNDPSLATCKDKAFAFQNYILGKDPTAIVYVRRVMHTDGTYMHDFVEMQGKVYDPTAQTDVYGWPVVKYLELIYTKGFDITRIM